MNDDTIRTRLHQADSLLGEYKRLLRPVLRELAARKSTAAGVQYSGDFGCWEQGIDTLCFHLQAELFQIPSNGSDLDWQREIQASFCVGLKHIHLRGYP